MQRSFNKDEFAALANLPSEEIDRLKSAGLLDLDRDGLFDDYDALRLAIVTASREEGLEIEEIAKQVREGTLEIPFIGHYLFRTKSAARTLEETSELVGMSPKKLQELRTAVGLAGPAQFDDTDIEAFRAAKVVTEWGMPWEAVIEVARVYGDAFRRIAQTEVRLLNSYVAEPMAQSGASDAEVSVQMRSVLQALYPVLAPLLDFFHRQYIAREAARISMVSLQRSEPPLARGSMDVAIAFVDLTSFTTLAQIHGDETAADVLDQFDHLVRSLVLKHHGSLVKQIGDAFMLAFEDPADAVRFSIALGEAAERHEHFLATRTGIHFGTALYRVGDYVGNTVNIASRLAAEAMPNEVLVTEAVAEAASKASVEVSQAGVRMLRGSAEPLSLYRILRPTSGAMRQDPVCGMTVDDETAAARLVRDGQEVLFCSEDCLRRFLEKPDLYAASRSS